GGRHRGRGTARRLLVLIPQTRIKSSLALVSGRRKHGKHLLFGHTFLLRETRSGTFELSRGSFLPGFFHPTSFMGFHDGQIDLARVSVGRLHTRGSARASDSSCAGDSDG